MYTIADRPKLQLLELIGSQIKLGSKVAVASGQVYQVLVDDSIVRVIYVNL
jgi:hypothetical protein